jgi:hypothetical protein
MKQKTSKKVFEEVVEGKKRNDFVLQAPTAPNEMISPNRTMGCYTHGGSRLKNNKIYAVLKFIIWGKTRAGIRKRNDFVWLHTSLPDKGLDL